MYMADRQTVSGAFAKIESHEELCAERYRAINDTLGELKTGVRGHGRAAWGIALALVAWMAAQLWSANQARVERLERPSAAAPAR
jgi:hypothetical protein